jgi:hypothetical protein
MDDVDMTNERTDKEIAGLIKKARAATSQYNWSDSCWCGQVEWTKSMQPHFCGTWCRDLYEKEMRMRKINGG